MTKYQKTSRLSQVSRRAFPRWVVVKVNCYDANSTSHHIRNVPFVPGFPAQDLPGDHHQLLMNGVNKSRSHYFEARTKIDFGNVSRDNLKRHHQRTEANLWR